MFSDIEYRIAWYARDGHLDLFPTIAAALIPNEVKVVSHYVCHNEYEAERLQSLHGIQAPVILPQYLRQHEARFVGTWSAKIPELAAKYDAIPLSRCLWGDLFELELTEAQRMRNLIGHFAFWEEFLHNNRIDMLVTERPSILSTCVAWSVCQALNVRFVDFIDIPPLGERMGISSSWEGHYDGLEEMIIGGEAVDEDREEYKAAAEYLERMKVRPEKTAEARRAMDASRRWPRGILWQLPTVVHRIRKRAEYYPYPRLGRRVRQLLREPFNRLRYKFAKVFDVTIYAGNDTYFLMPLHSPGEWSNYTWMGIEYADQAATVRRVANCLPPGTWLYVKEHTAGFGQRPLAFYRALRKCRQVRLIPPHVDTFRLIQDSTGVITLGSTMGFEAVVMQKPVILLGDPWYRMFPGVCRVDRPEALSELLQNIERLPVATETELRRCLSGLFRESFEGVKMPHNDTFTPENIAKLARALARRLEHSRRSPKHLT